MSGSTDVVLRRARVALAVLACIVGLPAGAADASHDVLAAVDAYATRQADVGLQLWAQPELGYLETRSSALLQDELRKAGFRVEAGVAGMPTAFVARYGKRGNGPVIALLAEMDALPGMSQAALPTRSPIAGQDAGRACGHNLFGAAVVGAAQAVAQWLAGSGHDGEVRVYGTPAEEGGSGKVYMTRAGLFNDVDVALHWHPAAANSAAQGTSTGQHQWQVPLQGHRRARGAGAGSRALGAGWRGSAQPHGQHDARARARRHPHPLRDQQRRRRAERGARCRRSVLLRAPRRPGRGARCDRPPAAGRARCGDGHRHRGGVRTYRRGVLAAAQRCAGPRHAGLAAAGRRRDL
ncbi:M20/M25/M40 family metallo-hydrolase [Stenotrophomonas rhizophila]